MADLAMTGAVWTAAMYRQAMAALVAGGVIIADEETDEVLVTRWWQDNSPSNENWFKGARKQCDVIASEHLRAAALEALEAFWIAFQAAQNPAASEAASQPLAPFGSVVSQALVERHRKFLRNEPGK